MERLSSMTDKFQREQDMTYRDQLQKIQYEISLVQRFDPYDPSALDVAAELQKEHRQTQGLPVHAENARSLMDMAGIKFPNFIDEIEDLIEIRDFQLTQSKVSFCSTQHWITPSKKRKKKKPPSPIRLTFWHLLTVLNRTNTIEKFKNTKTHMPTRSKQRSASMVPSPARCATA